MFKDDDLCPCASGLIVRTVSDAANTSDEESHRFGPTTGACIRRSGHVSPHSAQKLLVLQRLAQ